MSGVGLTQLYISCVCEYYANIFTETGMRPIIKKARLLARMTQVQVAEAVGVSQPTYQRWETGTVSVPRSKLGKLAKVLGISPLRVEGKPEPFDLFGIDKSVSDERRYFGEVAIHFHSGSAPLLLPLSEAERVAFCNAIQGDDAFIEVATLDNRIVFIRRKGIADVFLSSEAYDDYGPDEYGDQHLGVCPDDSFWKIVEHFDCTECLDDEFSDHEIEEAIRKISMIEADLDELIANGSIKAEERDKVCEEAEATTDRFLARARHITWQLSGGQSRHAFVVDNRAIYETFCELTLTDEDEILYLAPDGYHRSVFIRPAVVDYITVPAHKFRDGQIESAAEEMGEDK